MEYLIGFGSLGLIVGRMVLAIVTEVRTFDTKDAKEEV